MSPSTGLTAQGSWLLAGEEGGTSGDWRFGGCEGGLTRTRSLPNPCRSGSQAPCPPLPPSARCLPPVLSTASQGLFPLSYSSLLFFLLWTEGGISYIWKSIYSPFSGTELRTGSQEKLWQIHWGGGKWPSCPQGQRRLKPAPGSRCHINTQRPRATSTHTSLLC